MDSESGTQQRASLTRLEIRVPRVPDVILSGGEAGPRAAPTSTSSLCCKEHSSREQRKRPALLASSRWLCQHLRTFQNVPLFLADRGQAVRAHSAAQETNLQPKVGTSQSSSPLPQKVPATLPVLFLMFWDRWPQMAPPGGCREAAGQTLGKRLQHAHSANKEEAEEGSRRPQGASTPYTVLPGPGGVPTDPGDTSKGNDASEVLSPFMSSWLMGALAQASPVCRHLSDWWSSHPKHSCSLAPETSIAHAHLETGRQRPHKPREGLCLWPPGFRHCILGDKGHFIGAWPPTADWWGSGG